MTAITLEGLRDKNLVKLKAVNNAIFSIQYSDEYYSDAVASGEFSKLAYYCDVCVGSITCRLEMNLDGVPCVYIMTLGVLAPYRRLGVGTTLLNHVLGLCTKYNFGMAYLHVQKDNEYAINFFKKLGFAITDTIKNYYMSSTSPDSHVITKYFDIQTTK
ncbi:putative N-acetyltransferase [Handroanthus impetiginosus]|uniref:Putative N-acetyltransferase n=1 Tax=Handroanthus impetiginosus TaxID=429701 RepID=A0A2G9HLJ8_9LAMI|nr:putative N-acetyltransferase [Handroanthus impetiginosus]